MRTITQEQGIRDFTLQTLTQKGDFGKRNESQIEHDLDIATECGARFYDNITRTTTEKQPNNPQNLASFKMTRIRKKKHTNLKRRWMRARIQVWIEKLTIIFEMGRKRILELEKKKKRRNERRRGRRGVKGGRDKDGAHSGASALPQARRRMAEPCSRSQATSMAREGSCLRGCSRGRAMLAVSAARTVRDRSPRGTCPRGRGYGRDAGNPARAT